MSRINPGIDIHTLLFSNLFGGTLPQTTIMTITYTTLITANKMRNCILFFFYLLFKYSLISLIKVVTNYQMIKEGDELTTWGKFYGKVWNGNNAPWGPYVFLFFYLFIIVHITNDFFIVIINGPSNQIQLYPFNQNLYPWTCIHLIYFINTI